LIGFGAESTLMGGADTAVARDTTALNTNPAGLSQIKGSELDIYAGLAFALDVSHADVFGNDRSVANSPIGFGGGGYAKHVTPELALGVGLFAQGGAGNVYHDLQTAFGTRDELSSIFGIAKLSPGMAYQLTDKVSVGGSVEVVSARLKQKVFTNTSFFNAPNPAQSFFGYELVGMSATNYGVKLGLLLKETDELTLGATYSNRVDLPLEGGHMASNMSAVGLGSVTYRDVRVQGLALPREIGVGAAWQATPRSLISFKLDWLDWADALRTSTLTASNPDNAAAPSAVQTTAALYWKNQFVFAVGLAHEWNEKTTLWAGYNYGKNPIPTDHTNPLLAAIGERTVTVGFQRSIADEWKLASGIEYQFRHTVTYNNPELPFGPGTQERSEVLVLHVMLSKQW
jgi:long-chain fatty acid transport protein